MFPKLINHTSRLFVVTTDSGEGKAYYYLLADKNKAIRFAKEARLANIDVKDYGQIVYSGPGDHPSHITKFLQLKYNL